MFQKLYLRVRMSVRMKKKNQSSQLRSRFVSKILFKSENECENEQKNQSVKLRSRSVSKNFI
jgi:hypothetical protein